MKVETWSDIVCPWCYIGKRRFERAVAQSGGLDVELRFRPFQLDPGAPVRGVPLRQYLAARFGAGTAGMTSRVGQIAAEDGLVIDWDRAIAVNTFQAHRLIRLVESERGVAAQRAVVQALFEAHFARGLDVGAMDTLQGIAADAGLDAARTRAYLASDAGIRELRQELDHARAIGITSVPSFVFDDQYLVTGAQPVELFVEVLADLRTRAADAGGGAPAASR